MLKEAKNEIAKAIANLPIEQSLDLTKTEFVYDFAWSIETYPETTNPNLDGKLVLVLAIKKANNPTGIETVGYSFLNMEEELNTEEDD